ncbi:MAG TPA: hypothetical protein VGL45_00700 [Bradyrhizobium sp.]
MSTPSLAVLTAAALFSLTMPALAQAPSEAQRAAIRSACRSDFIAHCSSVKPGGIEALQCLQKNMSSLAPGCQSAVRAVEGGEAPKAESKPETKPEAKPETESETKPEAKPETKTEAKPEAKPEEKREIPAAATAAPAEKPAAATAPEPKSATAPTAPTAPAMARKPTSAQTAAVRSACRSDFIANCSSVQPGGPAALKCLMQNEARLSGRCKQAVAAIGGSAAPAGAPADTAAAPAAAPAVAPLVLRPMRPREVIFVLRSACGGDVRALCGDVPAGGGRILQCLAERAASLSPACANVLGQFAAR